MHIPDFDQEGQIIVIDGGLRDEIQEQGTIRLEELAEKRDVPRHELYEPLIQLVEDGQVAIFPVGDTVQVRDDS